MSVHWSDQQNLVIAFSFIGFVLVNIPLYWHLEAWNIGCVLYIFWTGSQCLIQFINCIVWKDNAINWAPVWCDITSRWLLASSIGICTASLLINRRLYKIATISTVSIGRDDKRRMVVIDLAIGLGVPVVQVILYWFIQGHRFDILEGFGCMFAIPNTILAWFLFDIWPIVIGLISAVYCGLTIRAFMQRRKQLNELLSSNTGLSFHRYFRLMGLAALEMCCTVPLGIYTMVINAKEPLYKWEGLANLHYQFSRVGQYPAIVWRSDPLIVKSLDFNMWSYITCALVFFAFFGFAGEARKHYRLACVFLGKRLGVRTSFFERFGMGTAFGSKNSKPSSSILERITIPTFVQRGTRPTSIVTFADKLSISVSVEELGPVGDVKVAYPPSVHTTVSSTCVPSQASHNEGAEVKAGSDPLIPAPVPTPQLKDPAFVLNISSERLERPLPDVPSSVRPNSIDMV
ncbi:hypothetical protein AcW1_007727 [Taiwanofungus camphoratus]|nr:hypothetical protein AcV7_009928 [Antrodia cinnamomea]KAI0953533.1 hypothetical protein AcW1_007727 [Antrodia cinnamomea]